jgi:5-methylcytosine-specific restriction protein A
VAGMSTLTPLSKGQTINNEQLCAAFGCSPQGGMRRAHRTNSLVLINIESY